MRLGTLAACIRLTWPWLRLVQCLGTGPCPSTAARRAHGLVQTPEQQQPHGQPRQPSTPLWQRVWPYPWHHSAHTHTAATQAPAQGARQHPPHHTQQASAATSVKQPDAPQGQQGAANAVPQRVHSVQQLEAFLTGNVWPQQQGSGGVTHQEQCADANLRPSPLVLAQCNVLMESGQRVMDHLTGTASASGQQFVSKALEVLRGLRSACGALHQRLATQALHTHLRLLQSPGSDQHQHQHQQDVATSHLVHELLPHAPLLPAQLLVQATDALLDTTSRPASRSTVPEGHVPGAHQQQHPGLGSVQPSDLPWLTLAPALERPLRPPPHQVDLGQAPHLVGLLDQWAMVCSPPATTTSHQHSGSIATPCPSLASSSAPALDLSVMSVAAVCGVMHGAARRHAQLGQQHAKDDAVRRGRGHSGCDDVQALQQQHSHLAHAALQELRSRLASNSSNTGGSNNSSSSSSSGGSSISGSSRGVGVADVARMAVSCAWLASLHVKKASARVARQAHLLLPGAVDLQARTLSYLAQCAPGVLAAQASHHDLVQLLQHTWQPILNTDMSTAHAAHHVVGQALQQLLPHLSAQHALEAMAVWQKQRASSPSKVPVCAPSAQQLASLLHSSALPERSVVQAPGLTLDAVTCAVELALDPCLGVETQPAEALVGHLEARVAAPDPSQPPEPHQQSSVGVGGGGGKGAGVGSRSSSTSAAAGGQGVKQPRVWQPDSSTSTSNGLASPGPTISPVAAAAAELPTTGLVLLLLQLQGRGLHRPKLHHLLQQRLGAGGAPVNHLSKALMVTRLGNLPWSVPTMLLLLRAGQGATPAGEQGHGVPAPSPSAAVGVFDALWEATQHAASKAQHMRQQGRNTLLMSALECLDQARKGLTAVPAPPSEAAPAPNPAGLAPVRTPAPLPPPAPAPALAPAQQGEVEAIQVERCTTPGSLAPAPAPPQPGSTSPLPSLPLQLTNLQPQQRALVRLHPGNLHVLLEDWAHACNIGALDALPRLEAALLAKMRRDLAKLVEGAVSHAAASTGSDSSTKGGSMVHQGRAATRSGGAGHQGVGVGGTDVGAWLRQQSWWRLFTSAAHPAHGDERVLHLCCLALEEQLCQPLEPLQAQPSLPVWLHLEFLHVLNQSAAAWEAARASALVDEGPEAEEQGGEEDTGRGTSGSSRHHSHQDPDAPALDESAHMLPHLLGGRLMPGYLSHTYGRAFDAFEELALLGDPTQRLTLEELVGVAQVCGAPCHTHRRQLWRWLLARLQLEPVEQLPAHLMCRLLGALDAASVDGALPLIGSLCQRTPKATLQAAGSSFLSPATRLVARATRRLELDEVELFRGVVQTLRSCVRQLDREGRLHVCTDLVGDGVVAQHLPELHRELQRGALEALEQLDPGRRMQWLLAMLAAHAASGARGLPTGGVGGAGQLSSDAGAVLLRVSKACAEHVTELTNQQAVDLLLGLTDSMQGNTRGGSQTLRGRSPARAAEVSQAHQVLLEALCSLLQQRLYSLKPVHLAALMGCFGRITSLVGPRQQQDTHGGTTQVQAGGGAPAAGASVVVPRAVRLVPESSPAACSAQHMLVVLRLRLQQQLPLSQPAQVLAVLECLTSNVVMQHGASGRHCMPAGLVDVQLLQVLSECVVDLLTQRDVNRQPAAAVQSPLELATRVLQAFAQLGWSNEQVLGTACSVLVGALATTQHQVSRLITAKGGFSGGAARQEVTSRARVQADGSGRTREAEVATDALLALNRTRFYDVPALQLLAEALSDELKMHEVAGGEGGSF